MTNDQCWEKFKFRKTHTKPHPIYKEEMKFEGLEADYVGKLESEITYLKEAYERLLQKQEWMTTQEMYRLKDQILKEKLTNGAEGNGAR